MFVVCVTIWVKPEFVQPFIEASLENARGTRQEPGNVRFDVLQSEDDPARFFLYEMYKSKSDFTAHQSQPHYVKWRDTVESWMAQSRQRLTHNSLFAE